MPRSDLNTAKGNYTIKNRQYVVKYKKYTISQKKVLIKIGRRGKLASTKHGV